MSFVAIDAIYLRILMKFVAATLFTTSSILSFSIWDNSTFFCSSLRPPSPLPTEDPNDFYCPVSAGPIAFSAAIPFGSHDYELLTIDTRLRVVDTSSPANELACVDISTTPLTGDESPMSLYGPAIAVFWASVGLAIAYWVVAGIGRLVAAWGRGGTGSGRTLWSRAEGAGYILASAISGERFSSTPALLRFGTASSYISRGRLLITFLSYQPRLPCAILSSTPSYARP